MIHLHLGAHKTASTYLQELLARNVGLVAESGRTAPPLAQLRPIARLLRHKPTPRPGLRGVIDLLRHERRRRAARHELRRWLASRPDAILSEENLIGYPADALDGRFYPAAAERILRISSQFGPRPVTVYLGIRAYPSFLASLYAEALRHGHKGSIADLLRANPDPSGQWLGLVRRVHAALPQSRIVCWRYEDFVRIHDELVARLSGVAAERLQPLATPHIRPGPSAEAIARQAAIAAGLTQAERVSSMASLERLHPPRAGEDTFAPFGALAIDLMGAAYEEDCAAIARLPYVTVLGA